MNEFTDQIAIAKANKIPGKPLPCIEVPRCVLEHFNKGNMEAVDSVGYFVFSDVRVYEVGKKEGSQAQEAKTISQRLFNTRL